jgi:hypothetical protein
MTELDFHLLNPRIFYGFALDECWLVDVGSHVAVGDFVEVLSSFGGSNQVMAQGRATRVRSHSPGKILLDLSPVTSLSLLEAACAAR